MTEALRGQTTVRFEDTDGEKRLSVAAVARYIQMISAAHCNALGFDRDTLEEKRLFWAIIRNRILIHSLPAAGQLITLETWPMPTTRTAFPRAVVAYDEAGNKLFESHSLWILMDMDTRAMVLPEKSGIGVPGITLPHTPPAPSSLSPCKASHTLVRQVTQADIDQNGHMNNGRYLAWIADLLPPNARLRDVKLCYLSEALPGETLAICWETVEENQLAVDIRRDSPSGESQRIFSARLVFDDGVL